MQEKKEYIYEITVTNPIIGMDLIFKAMDFYAISSIAFTNDIKLSNRISDLAFVLKQHCVKEQI